MAGFTSQSGVRNDSVDRSAGDQRSGLPDTEQSQSSSEAGPARNLTPSAPNPGASDSRESSRWFLFIVVAVCLIGMGVQWIWLTRAPEPLPWQTGPDYDRLFRVDVNNATWIEWSQLDGIGQGLAHRIVADRRFNGPFLTIEAVARVPGIGEVTLERIRPWLVVRQDSIELRALDPAIADD